MFEEEMPPQAAWEGIPTFIKKGYILIRIGECYNKNRRNKKQIKNWHLMNIQR